MAEKTDSYLQNYLLSHTQWQPLLQGTCAK